MKKKNILTVVVAFLLIISMLLAGCGKPAADGNDPDDSANNPSNEVPDNNNDNAPTVTGKSDETLVVAIPAEPVTMVPLLGDAGNMDSFSIWTALHVPLFTLNEETFAIENGGLVKEVEEIEPGTYRLHLRDNVAFNDGTVMNAYDVIYSLEKYYEAGIQFTQFIDYEATKAEDEFTVLYKNTEYQPGWQFMLTMYGMFSESVIEAAGGLEEYVHNPAYGCGKYVLNEWKVGQYVMLERNESYWDTDYEGYYKYIKFIPIPDGASRVMAVQSGDADVAAGITVAQAKALEGDPNVEGVLRTVGTVYNLYFNNETGVFTDPKVREAVSYMVDSEAVNALVNMGMGEVVQGLWSDKHPYYKEYFEGGKHPYDPEKGKQLLAEAGYPDGITVKLTCATLFEQIAIIIQESLRDGGVNVELQITEPSVNILSIRQGDYDLSIAGTTNSVERSDAWDLVDPAMIGITNGGARITDPQMSEYIAMAKSPDPEVCAEGWDKVIDYVFSNNCLVGLCNLNECYAVEKGLTGLYAGPQTSAFFVTSIKPAA